MNRFTLSGLSMSTVLVEIELYKRSIEFQLQLDLSFKSKEKIQNYSMWYQNKLRNLEALKYVKKTIYFLQLNFVH
jgi:hypothetical protein